MYDLHFFEPSNVNLTVSKNSKNLFLEFLLTVFVHFSTFLFTMQDQIVPYLEPFDNFREFSRTVFRYVCCTCASN